MDSVAIVTADFGGFDHPHRQVDQDILVDWHYLRALPLTQGSEEAVPLPWRTTRGVYDPSNPRLAAKTPKIAPWTVFPGYRYYIWIDASMEVTSPSFAREAIEDLGEAPVAAFRHPRRDGVIQELVASVGPESQGKYDAAQLGAQVTRYVRNGYRDDMGLFACGTLAWDSRDPNARYISKRWLYACRTRSVQDQLSFPYACWIRGVEPAIFRYPQMGESGWDRANPWMYNHPHAQ